MTTSVLDARIRTSALYPFLYHFLCTAQVWWVTIKHLLTYLLYRYGRCDMRGSYRPTKNPQSFTKYLRSIDRSWLFFTIHLHDICNSFHCYKLLLSQTIARLQLCLHFAPEEYICSFLTALSVNKQVIDWNIPQNKKIYSLVWLLTFESLHLWYSI